VSVFSEPVVPSLSWQIVEFRDRNRREMGGGGRVHLFAATSCAKISGALLEIVRCEPSGMIFL
jgi:hypothetical protein